MTGDFSRDSHQPGRWQAVQLQQGRVTLDADWNEQAAIAAFRDAQAAQAAIGRVGRPKGEWAITVSGGNIAIGAGTLWLDGVPCVAKTGFTLVDQPFRPLAASTLAALGDVDSGAGDYALVVTAWRRTVSPVTNPELLEPALGSADTAAREEWVWQVSLRRFSPAAGADCANPGAGWQLPGPRGQMTAYTVAPAVPADPCQIPPTAQFRGLSNQLYRIEIHRGGDLSTARFKWSRENASVATALVRPSGGAASVAGPSLNVATLGRDAETGFAGGQWVELEDEILALGRDPIPLRKVLSVDAGARTVTLAAAAASAVSYARGARLRRWDQTAGDENGMALGAGIAIENGLTVDFQPGQYRKGDFWLVPARTAVANVAGDIMWPRSGGAYQPQPSFRRFHEALLTVVHFDGTAFTRLPAFGDCVPTFPPLTAITASDVSYTPQAGGPLVGTKNVQEALDKLATQTGACSVVVRPGPGWESVFATLPPGDLDICFQAGDFPTPAAGITISGNRRVQIGGAGPGSRIRNPSGETALRFSGLTALRVHGISVAGVPAGSQHLNGALHVEGCRDVEIGGVSASTGGGGARRSAALTVQNEVSANAYVAIRNCHVEVGGRQYGILIVNADRAEVTDNIVSTSIPASREADGRRLLKERAIQGRVVAYMLKERASIKEGSDRFSLFSRMGFRGQASADVTKEVRALAETTGPLRNGAQVLAEFFAVVSRLNAPEYGARGICIAGSKIGEAIVRGNAVRFFRSNIHVAVSHRETARGTPDVVGSVRIEDNDIRLALSGMDESGAGDNKPLPPHGILVGNADDVVIAGNRLANDSVGTGKGALAPCAITVLGAIGRRLFIRENRVTGFRIAVTVPKEKRTGLWRMADNLADRVTTLVSGAIELGGSDNVRIG